jgi:hypothetical protein
MTLTKWSLLERVSDISQRMAQGFNCVSDLYLTFKCVLLGHKALLNYFNLEIMLEMVSRGHKAIVKKQSLN